MQSDEIDAPFQNLTKNQFQQQEKMGSSLLDDDEEKEEKEVRSNINSDKLTQELIDEMLAEEAQAYL